MCFGWRRRRVDLLSHDLLRTSSFCSVRILPIIPAVRALLLLLLKESGVEVRLHALKAGAYISLFLISFREPVRKDVVRRLAIR